MPVFNPWLTGSARHRWLQQAMQVLVAALVAVPLAAITLLCIASVWDATAWQTLWNEQLHTRSWWAAWGMTLWTGLASSLLAYGLCAWLVSRSFATPLWARVVRVLGPMLAVPHAAFAVGLVFLVSPSGWLLRALSPWLTGLTQPPAWPTSQDPWGLGMIAVLVCKELPFLLWSVATQLQRDDTNLRLTREMQAAQTLGYSQQASFWRIVWPQLAQRIRWPVLAVLAYGLTVVDVALIAGPSNPSTLAVRAWQFLQDADVLQNTLGAMAGWLLAFTVAVVAVAWMRAGDLPWLRARRLRGWHAAATRAQATGWGTHAVLGFVAIVYLVVLLALLVGSFSGVWAFPNMLPANFNLHAWRSVMQSSASVGTTLALALASTLLAMVWSVAWLELQPARWNRVVRGMLYVPLLLPSVLWVIGLHRLALHLNLGASWPALILAHSLAVMPYTMIVLSPAYQGFDARYAAASASMGRPYSAFLLYVKWPLLRASLWSACAVGVAVSVAQYLPTLYVSEGRFTTVTTEAVNLAAGGQRSLVAAYAWLQWLIPVLGFATAAWLGQPRRFAVVH